MVVQDVQRKGEGERPKAHPFPPPPEDTRTVQNSASPGDKTSEHQLVGNISNSITITHLSSVQLSWGATPALAITDTIVLLLRHTAGARFQSPGKQKQELW